MLYQVHYVWNDAPGQGVDVWPVTVEAPPALRVGDAWRVPPVLLGWVRAYGERVAADSWRACTFQPACLDVRGSCRAEVLVEVASGVML